MVLDGLRGETSGGVTLGPAGDAIAPGENLVTYISSTHHSSVTMIAMF